MKCVVNWISLRICVRSRNTQPHLQSFWDLTEVSAESWYTVRTYHLVNPTFKIQSIGKKLGFSRELLLRHLRVWT